MKTSFEDEKNDGNDELHLEEDDDDEENINQIEQIAKELAADYQINDWVAVLYFEKWYPVVVQNVRL